MDNFFFVSSELEFEESVGDKGARIVATVMELEKVSGNNKLYKIEEGEQIAKSLAGVPVYYGTDWMGKHDNPIKDPKSNNDPVGFVEIAKVVGNKIKATIKITAHNIIDTLKQGVKYLFSVGGNAISETIKHIGEKIVHILHGARCNHLQIVPFGTPVGFPSAKLEKVLEINETVMLLQGDDVATPHFKIVSPNIETIEYHDTKSFEYIEEE